MDLQDLQYLSSFIFFYASLPLKWRDIELKYCSTLQSNLNVYPIYARLQLLSALLGRPNQETDSTGRLELYFIVIHHNNKTLQAWVVLYTSSPLYHIQLIRQDLPKSFLNSILFPRT